MQTSYPGSASPSDAPPQAAIPAPAAPSAEFLHKELDLLYSLYAQTDASARLNVHLSTHSILPFLAGRQ